MVRDAPDLGQDSAEIAALMPVGLTLFRDVPNINGSRMPVYLTSHSCSRFLLALGFALANLLVFDPIAIAQQAKPVVAATASIANFTDLAEKAGLTAQNIFGG